MPWTVAIAFILLWALGVATSHTLGGFIHMLILLAVGLVFTRFIVGADRRGQGPMAEIPTHRRKR